MYVYISESEKFTTFNESELFWNLKDIEYGNWNSGENKDGMFVFCNQVEFTDVKRDLNKKKIFKICNYQFEKF